MTGAAGTGGFFLVLEGVEGAGKSTHAHRIARRLERLDVRCRLLREPGGTAVGERIRDLVLDRSLDPLSETELLLMLAARAELVRRVLGPALAAGETVIADRYELSSFVYQGAGRGLGVDRVRDLNAFATGGLRPDAVLLLDIEAGAGLRRKRPGRADRLEGAGEAFHDIVARAYRELAPRDLPVIVVPTCGSTDDVEARIWHELSIRWPERFPIREQSAGG